MRFNGAVATRSRLESALSQTGTTVTAFLEQLVGEPVDAHELRHVMIEARTPNLLGVGEGHPLLQRSSVLQGRRSQRPYVHAESLLVPSRLPAAFCRQLETSSDPIGRILAKEGIVFTRSQLPRPDSRSRTRTCRFSRVRGLSVCPDVPNRHRRGSGHGDFRVVPSGARVVLGSFLTNGQTLACQRISKWLTDLAIRDARAGPSVTPAHEIPLLVRHSDTAVANNLSDTGRSAGIR